MDDFSFEIAKQHRDELIQAAETGHKAQLAQQDHTEHKHRLLSTIGGTLSRLGANLTSHKRGLDKLNYYSSNLRLE